MPAATRGLLTGLVLVSLRGVSRGQKLLPAMLTAKIEGLSTAFSSEGRRFVHCHSANRVFCHELLFGELVGRHNEERHQQYADNCPEPHVSAHPAVH